MKHHSTLLGGAALLCIVSPAVAQPAPPPPQAPADTNPAQPVPTPTQQTANAPTAQSDTTAAQSADEDFGDEEPIVVQGTRARGSVVGDIPPVNVLDSRDVRATGATNINDLLDALAPQIGSSQGRGGERPLILINGQRVSSFRELRDIPTEAIERVEILPEEVALKYGTRPDQKVVNIVLRQRFYSTTAQVGAGTSTEGGHTNESADLTRFIVEKNGRTTLNLHAEGNSLLRESQRDILITQQPPAGETTADELAARSLLPSKRDLRASGTFNREILGDVSATLNTEFEHVDGRSLIGLGDTLIEALQRNTSTDTAHAGVTMNGVKSNWRWTLTSNADLERDTTGTDRDALDAVRDRTVETTESGDIKATANGKLFSLPGGDATTTITLGGTTTHLNSERRLIGVTSSHSLGRTTGEAAMNFDIPISRRNHDFSALGNLTINANAEVDQLSDFGTLTVFGAGTNWSPVDRLNFLASWTREEGPPTVNQLGDPVLETPGTRVFDFATGQTDIVTAITGGNPNLQSDLRHVLKLGANWQPIANTDLRLRAEYVHQTIDHPIQNLTVTPTIEQAFPNRFVRNGAGQLVSVDLTPVNFESSENDTLRIGFDFSHPLKSHRPSQSVIDQIRAQFRSQFGARGGAAGPNGRPASPEGNPSAPATSPANGASTPSTSQQAGTAPAAQSQQGGNEAQAGRQGGGGFRGGGGGGGRGGGGFFGGGNRGRITFSLTDSITFVNRAIIAPGLPAIDFLHGDAAGQTGGTPRHSIQAQTGYFNNGLGARLTANWRTGTTVNTLTGDRLRFSPLATFDLRLFANPGDIPELTVKHPWLRGTQVQLQLNNMFNTRPKVHDALGNVPLNFQPDLLDPLGRTIMISFRKLFLPPRSWLQRQFQERQQQNR
ncbi:MAG TPA: TonB-dependent receptor plug domain-containing protein [Sphingomicrobium sp.]|nr:TonB-dependent receptor plug domain-containing protein [Sphingomicrobium sp.]